MTLEKEISNEERKSSNVSGVNDEKPFLSMRWLLVILSFGMFFIQFFIRNSFPVALVAMVNTTTSDESVNNSKDTCPAAVDNANDPDDSESSQGEYSWTASEQGIILGAYFWGFFFSKLLVSRAGEVVGQRATLATTNIAGGVLVLLSPLSASLHPYALAAARFLTGFCHGPAMASVQSLLSTWAPRSELSSMFAILIAGAPLGGTTGLMISGWIADQFGWRAIFWFSGLVSFTVPPIWIFFVRNTPDEHPFLTSYERNLLKENKHIKMKKTVPWKEILTSPLVYICVYALFARNWLDVLLGTEGPSYFRYKVGLDLDSASYVSGSGYLIAVFTIILYGILSDFLINRKYLSKANTRKFFHFLASGMVAILLVCICIADCEVVPIIIIWLLLSVCGAGAICSYNLSIIDIAPNYAGTVTGLTALGNLGSAFAPLVTSAFLDKGNGWNKSFYLAAIVNTISCIIYLLFMTAEPQPWNFYEDSNPTKKLESSRESSRSNSVEIVSTDL